MNPAVRAVRRNQLPVKTLLTSILCVLVLSLQCLANNNLFLPGDAFFPTVMTKDDVIRFVSTRSHERTITYKAIDKHGGALCGWAGFNRARIVTADDQFAENLQKAYDQLRKIQPRMLRESKVSDKLELIETNSMRVLFYSKDFDFKEYHLGVTYNENWIEQIEQFGHDRKHIQFSSLVDKSEAVAHCWRDGSLIPAMAATIPDIEVGQKDQPAISIECPVKAIVLANGTLDEFFDSDGEKYLRIYVVTSEGIEEWINHEWELKQVI